MTVDSGETPDTGERTRVPRLRGPGTTVSSPVRAAMEAVLRSLVLTAYIFVPLLVRLLPTGCEAAVLPLRPRDRGWRAWLRGASGEPTDTATFPAVVDPTPTSLRAARTSDWMERAAVRVWRLSAWRNARSRASVIPALTRPPLPAFALEADSWSPDTSGSGSSGPWDVRSELTIDLTDQALGDHEPRFPIDVVYTWVDDRDPGWQERYTRARQLYEGENLDAETASPARFHNRDELRYSLRSLALYAPFVRNVYIVTAGQVPDWLDTAAPNVRVVPHEEILGPDCLPTFNSHAIESRLHHIEGLAEHYLYLNDDFFFGRPVRPSTFFTADGRPKLFFDQRAMVPDGPCSPADRPVDSASKNTREIMAAEFDYVVKYKMQHAPYAQQRTLLTEMEQRFRPAFKQTARNPFRHFTDVNIPSCFSHYYGFVTGAAVPGRIQGSYINIGNPWAELTMRRLLRRADRDVFCLNDTPMRPRRRALVDASVRSFLEAYFPVRSPFERDPSAAQAPVARHVREAVQGR